MKVLFIFLIIQVVVALGQQFQDTTCGDFKNCVSCTNSSSSVRIDCRWCANKCISVKSATALCPAAATVIRYDDTCPVSHPAAPSALTNWMGDHMSIIGDMTLLDLSLPGTHDTLTDDLSEIVSDGGADDMYLFAKLLHDYEALVPDFIEDFIRQQAQTHDLNIVDQLNNGMRFLDLRIMFEYSDEVPDWYSLHFLQTYHPAITYLKSIRQWMDSHPQEIVVMWLSKHGNTCSKGNDQYPNTTATQKQAYWAAIEEVFSGLLVDFSVTQINETTVSEMISRSHRAVFYVSDYEEFTDSSKYALDGCLIDNQTGPSVDVETRALAWERSLFSNATEIIAEDKKKQRLFLMSLASGPPAETTALAAAIRFLPNKTHVEDMTTKCSSYFELPGLHWCPPTLLDISQMENYYKQISLEEAVTKEGWSLPNAIYLNALDWYGTIRTGSQVLWGAERSTTTTTANHATTAYAYADSFILVNVQAACGLRARPGGSKRVDLSPTVAADCQSLLQKVNERRAKFPATFWNDPQYGRLVNWP